MATKLQRILWTVGALLLLSLGQAALAPVEEGANGLAGCAAAADGMVFGTAIDGTYDPYRDPPCGGAPLDCSTGGKISY